MKRILSLAAISLLVVSSPVQGQEGSGDGLELSVSQVEGAATSQEFLLALDNVGKEDRVVNLGMMLANGKALYPTAVQLIITDESGTRRTLVLRGPAGIAGRVDDYVVPLKAGSTYSFRVTLNDYWSPSTPEWNVVLPRGTYHVMRRYVGQGAKFINADTEGMKLLALWEGELESKPLEFSIR